MNDVSNRTQLTRYQSVYIYLPRQIYVLVKKNQLPESVAKKALRILTDDVTPFSKEARIAAEKYTWDNYYKNIPAYGDYGNKSPFQKILEEFFQED